MSTDCDMVKQLVEYLWLKGSISTQQYENLFFGNRARDLKDINNVDYKSTLENYKKNNKIDD